LFSDYHLQMTCPQYSGEIVWQLRQQEISFRWWQKAILGDLFYLW
jgi:hypothetical protein